MVRAIKYGSPDVRSDVLAGKLGFAVVAQRFRAVVFTVRTVLAVEHVVTRHVDDGRRFLARCIDQMLHTADIDLPGDLAFGLARIHVRHRRTIDDDVGIHRPDKVLHRLPVRDVGLQVRCGSESRAPAPFRRR